MNCPKCNSSFTLEEQICTNCGALLSNQAFPRSSTMASSNPGNKFFQQHIRNNKLMYSVSGAIILVILVFGSFIAKPKNSNQESKVMEPVVVNDTSKINKDTQAPGLSPFPEVDKNRIFALWFDKDRTFIASGISTSRKVINATTTIYLSTYVQMNKGTIKEVRYTFVGCAFMLSACESSSKMDEPNYIPNLKPYKDMLNEPKSKYISYDEWVSSTGHNGSEQIKYIESYYGISAIVFRFEDTQGNIFHPSAEVLVKKPVVEPDPLYSVIAGHKDGKTFFSFPCSPRGDICTKEWRVTKNCPIATEFSNSLGDPPQEECYLSPQELDVYSSPTIKK